MYEDHTCEISMLSRHSSPFWTKAQAVQSLSKDLDYSTSKARSSCRSNHIGVAPENSHGGTKSQKPGQYQKSPHDRAGLGLPFSPDVARIREKIFWSNYSSGVSGPFGRWAVVPLSRSSLDALSGGGQAASSQSSLLSGSAPFGRPRKSSRLETIHPGDSSGDQDSDKSRCRRQLSRRQTLGPEKRLDFAIVSLSPHLSAPGTERTSETVYHENAYPRIDLSAHPYDAGTPRWSSIEQSFESLESGAKICSSPTVGDDHPRIPQKTCSLSRVSKVSPAGASHNHQYHRIDGTKDSGPYAPSRQSAYTPIVGTLGYSFYPDEANNDVQW